MAFPHPILPSIYVPGGKQESSKLVKMEKIGDWGVTGMFVGYASNHKGDCYRMWNPNTKRFPSHVMWCFSTGCSSEQL
jgi:hypothetical protein